MRAAKKVHAGGRPKKKDKPELVMLTVRVDPETLAALDRLCDAYIAELGPGAMVSGGRSQTLRRLIIEGDQRLAKIM